MDQAMRNEVELRMDIEATEHSSETILYVEDESFVREVTREILESAGYRVWTARDAVEALQICALHGPEVDLLLTDVVLPGDSGPELAVRVRRDHPQVRLLYVTGYPEQLAMLSAGDESFLAKPFSTAALLREVGEILERSMAVNVIPDRSRAAGSVVLSL